MQCSLVERHHYLEKPNLQSGSIVNSISRRQQDPLKCC